MKQLFFKIIVSVSISLILVVPTSLAACLAAGNTQVAASHSPIVTNKKIVKKVIRKKKKMKKVKKAKKTTPQQGAGNNTQGASGATGTSIGTGTVPSTEASQPKTWQVSIASMAFAQSSLTIKKGDSVKFTNNDDVPHQVASDPHPIHTNLPALNGAIMNKGDMFEMKFDIAGTYTYHCHLHPNMRGTITVTE